MLILDVPRIGVSEEKEERLVMRRVGGSCYQLLDPGKNCNNTDVKREGAGESQSLFSRGPELLSTALNTVVCHASKFFHRIDFSVYKHHFYTYLKRLTTCPLDFSEIGDYRQTRRTDKKNSFKLKFLNSALYES